MGTGVGVEGVGEGVGEGGPWGREGVVPLNRQRKKESQCGESASSSFQILPQPGKDWEGVAPMELPGIDPRALCPTC